MASAPHAVSCHTEKPNMARHGPEDVVAAEPVFACCLAATMPLHVTRGSPLPDQGCCPKGIIANIS